jgi:unsaturated rhamnogalacturonyl hydrolase
MKKMRGNTKALMILVIERNMPWFGPIIVLLIAISCSGLSSKEKRLPFIVSIDRNDTTRYSYFLLNYPQVAERFGRNGIADKMIRVHDLNNDEIMAPQLVDTNNDEQPDYIRINTKIRRNEPLRPFELVISKNEKQVLTNDPPVNNQGPIQIVYVNSFGDYSKNTRLEGKWASTIAQTFIETYPNPADLEIFEPGEWTYTNGFFLNGLCYYDQIGGVDKYLEYVQHWLDCFVNAEGEIDTLKYLEKNYRLDDILPGRSLLYVYQKTGNTKYLKAAEVLMDQLKNQPRTSDGGYWHKKMYNWQMWLDGIYMSDVFILQYAIQTNHPEYIDEAIFQIKLIYKNTRDSVTGLMAHGWDESRSKIWADPVSGKSSEFWGRGMGWYIMALVDGLDYIPRDYPKRKEILDILKNISDALLKYQDKETGLWYQVLDKAKQSGNWPESSCSAMIAYAFLKAYKMGYLPEKFSISAQKAYEGIKKHFIYFDDAGKIYVTGTVKVGTLNEEVSNGSYDYYVSVDRRVNDFKGVAALLYLAEVDEFMNKQKPVSNE